MRKIMNLPDDTTMDDLSRLSDMFEYPIVVKLRRNLELWSDEYQKTTGLEALKRLFGHLSNDAPPADSPHWDEYEETMRQLEAELRGKGVDL